MFGIGMPEMILICALALIVVGPDKLPDLARSIAKGVLELKKTAAGLKESLAEELEPSLKTVRPELEEASKALKENLEQQQARSNQSISETAASQNEVSSAEEPVQLEKNEATPQPAAPSSPSMTTEELIARAQRVKNNDLGEEKTNES